MAKYIISQRASYDLDDIADYTIQTLGSGQADDYVKGLKACFESLLRFKKRGRSADKLAPNLRSVVYCSHTIFYQVNEPDILIVRVLHQSQDVKNHL
ncbi:MAG: type II toxin-antitoxin system RelE/ParE family toxin [Asticcacaulis sp.]